MRWSGLWVALALGGCTGTDKSDGQTGATGATGATADTGCEVLEQTCAPTGTATTYPACPQGYQCSGIPAFWCYRGPSCSPPECLPPETAIDTPSGPRAVSELAEGDVVWTLSGDDAVPEPLLAVRSRVAPPDHRVVDLLLADGRTLRASPGHPTADGRRLGDLRRGDVLDGAKVVRAALVPYDEGRTWDLLPDGATGAYWADGVLIGSTLR